jgi:hypothetical protein
MVIKNDLNREEVLLVGNPEPEANNNLTSRAMFLQRKLYDKVAFTSSQLPPNEPLDMWYEKPFYGRSDVDSRAIHISEEYLAQIPSGDPDSYFAANFAVAAFNDMRQEFAYLRSRRAINPEGPLAVLDVKKAWINPNSLYHFLMESVLYERFKSYVSRYNLESKIRDFSSFVSVFIDYVNIETPKIPFTRSKAILTNKLSPMISGLAIEIDEKLHSDDQPKFQEIINDPNFPIYKEIAMRYGFLVDKHAPWRLVADIGSPALAPYLEAQGVSKDTVIDKYYYKSHLVDLEALKVYIVEFYNSYVTARPTIVKPHFNIDRNGEIRVLSKKIERKPREISSLGKEYGDWFWLRIYAFIRAREENKQWNQSFFEIVTRNAFYYLNGKDINTALDYIDRKCKIPSASTRKERDFTFINTIKVI